MANRSNERHSFHGAKKSGRWTPEQLESMRMIADPPADEVIKDYFEKDDALAVHELFLALLDERIPGSKRELVPVSQQLLNNLAAKDPVPPKPDVDFEPAQQLLRDHGPEIMMMLGCYSLPMAYSAANGAAVLAQTGYLEKRVMRRLVETAQMVIDVLKHGGLDADGDGIRSAREVRLLHGAIRYLIHQKGEWDADVLGEPINQEDMAGTLMVFSAVVIDGFNKIGLDMSEETENSYLALWRYVGQVMGMHPELLPDSPEQAKELTLMIYDAQMASSELGCELMTSLLATMKDTMPFPIARHLPPSLVRIFMKPEAADGLNVPKRPILDSFTRIVVKLVSKLDNLSRHFGLTKIIFRWFSRGVIEMLKLMGRGGNRQAVFDIPRDLHAEW